MRSPLRPHARMAHRQPDLAWAGFPRRTACWSRRGPSTRSEVSNARATAVCPTSNRRPSPLARVAPVRVSQARRRRSAPAQSRAGYCEATLAAGAPATARSSTAACSSASARRWACRPAGSNASSIALRWSSISVHHARDLQGFLGLGWTAPRPIERLDVEARRADSLVSRRDWKLAPGGAGINYKRAVRARRGLY